MSQKKNVNQAQITYISKEREIKYFRQTYLKNVSQGSGQCGITREKSNSPNLH